MKIAFYKKKTEPIFFYVFCFLIFEWSINYFFLDSRCENLLSGFLLYLEREAAFYKYFISIIRKA